MTISKMAKARSVLSLPIAPFGAGVLACANASVLLDDIAVPLFIAVGNNE